MKKTVLKQKRSQQPSLGQLVIGLVLVLGAVLGALSITKTQYLGSDASSRFASEPLAEVDGPVPSQYGMFFPNRAGAMLNTNEPWPWMAYKAIGNQNPVLRLTTINTNPAITVGYYGKFTVPVFYTKGGYPTGEPQTTAQIYGWTTDPCTTTHGFTFHPTFQQADGSWIVSGNELIHFGAISNPSMHCKKDKSREGWNSFWGEGAYIGNVNNYIYAGAISFSKWDWGYEPAYYEVAKVTLNKPVESWPPTN